MNFWPLIIVAFVLLLVGIGVCVRRLRRRAADARARRESLAEGQFGERSFPPELWPIASHLRRVASEQLGKDLSQLQPDDRLPSVFSDPFDSLDSVELLMAIEEEFGVELDDDAVTNMQTCRDLVTAVAAQRPFLAKWRRSLGRALEEQIGVSLPRQELATVATPRALADAVAGQLKDQVGGQRSCQSQRAFYLLRNAMTRILALPRRSITPATELLTLISWRAARAVWPQLRDAVAARNWPALARPRWIGWFIFGLPLLGGIALALGLPTLADWASRRSSSLAFALCFASEMRLFLVIPLVIVCWVLLVRLSKRLAFSFPRNVRTVGDLIPFVGTSAQMTWTREQIEQKVREIVLTQLPLPAERYRAEGRFREDFGLEAGLENL